jgi:ATP synthase protein I
MPGFKKILASRSFNLKLNLMKNPWHPWLSMSLRLGIDFVAAILIGVFIGHGLDVYLNTYPWGLVIFMVMGIIAGSLSVYRSVKTLISSEATSKNDQN